MPKKPSIAVIYFPGNNCEEESLKAVLAAGMDGKIVRWNQRKEIAKYDGFVIPGGWGYEDRIRAGVIMAKDPVFDAIKKEAEAEAPADKGSPPHRAPVRRGPVEQKEKRRIGEKQRGKELEGRKGERRQRTRQGGDQERVQSFDAAQEISDGIERLAQC